MKNSCRSRIRRLSFALLVCLSLAMMAGACAPAAPAAVTITAPTPTIPSPTAISPRTLVIGPTALPSGLVSLAYRSLLAAGGGIAPYVWSLAAGNLPPGLFLDSSGNITGTPGLTGSFDFTVRVTDRSSPPLGGQTGLSITIKPTPLSVITSSLPAVVVGLKYDAALTAGGGTPPYSWSLASGSLPAGLTLDTKGVISGTPTAAGSANFTMKVTDGGNPAQSAPGTFLLKVLPAPLDVTTTSLQGGKAGKSYSASLAAAGGTLPYTWTIVGGNLPAGLSLAPGGAISGTPTAGGSSGFTVRVRDSSTTPMSSEAALAVTVTPPAPTIATATLSPATVSLSYSASLAASSGVPPYTWSVSGGSLPSGLLLNSSGVITGTPTLAGTYTFTVRLVDNDSPPNAVEQLLTLVVRPYIAPTATALP